MAKHSRKSRLLAATGIVVVMALTGAAPTYAGAINPEFPGEESPTNVSPPPKKPIRELRSLRGDRGGEFYVWMVNGKQRGIPFG